MRDTLYGFWTWLMVQARDRSVVVAAWQSSIPYTAGDRVNLHIPPTWWDRVRMFFGFKRKSPATEMYECVGIHGGGDER
jgi:hypothetical protein